MRLVIVSGLSGTGKTVALKLYEDLGYYCIDNIPLDLALPLIAHAVSHPDPRYSEFAIGVDARASPSEIKNFPEVLRALRDQGVHVHVLFLTASDQVILRRYNETRRKHPLSGPEVSLAEAMRLERKLLEPIAALADDLVDTSAMNLHDLRGAIHERQPEAGSGRLAVLFLSFGFKNGLPDGADFVFDVRNLPNPHWVPELRPLTGRDEAVAQFLEGHGETTALLDDIRNFLVHWLPSFQQQDRSYVTVAIGCTGGQHRSVYMVEQLAASFQGRFGQVIAKHRELGL
ncbi:MAG TPA: RNase adapter RapZ [Nevskia sp.]|nr:RNase adapter RapZ [Nevskia sp.]